MLLLTGGFAAQHSRVLLSSDLCLSLFVACFAVFFVPRCRSFALLLLGYLVFIEAGTQILDDGLNRRYEGDSMLTEVRIIDFPKPANASITLLVEPIDDHRLPPRSRVSWFEPSEVPRLGEIWQLELRLRRPRGNSNPGGFRLEDWMFREGIHASGYVVSGKRNHRVSSDRGDWQSDMRREFVEFVTANGGDSAAVIVAVGIGTRHLITQQQWDRYAQTGTSHLMAISGLHVGLAATSSYLLLVLFFGALRLRGNHLIWAMTGAATIAVAYAFLSGFAVPSQRASLMLALAALAFVLHRGRDSPRLVALVVVAVFLIDPVSLLRPGFVLSFAAVVVLLWFSAASRLGTEATNPITRVMIVVRQLNGMQLALLMGLIPITTMAFHRISILAPFVNLVAVPIFSLVTVPLTLIALITFQWFPTVGAVAVQVSAVSVMIIEAFIAFSAALPFSNLTISTSGLHRIVIYLPALWVILPRCWPGRWLAPLAVLALLVYRPAAPRPSCLDLHVLDVGQGLAVVAQTQTHTLLFDTGPAYRGGGSAARQVILPFLRYRGIKSIDWLVVSHADNDHAGGVATLSKDIKLDKIYVGEAIPQPGTRFCSAGQQWTADGVSFGFHHPPANKRRDGNDASCVLSITAGNHRLLLTGDIEVAAERDVLQRADLGTIDLVVIPHHGSLTSSSPAFVRRSQPRIAIASAAYGNRWDFPRPAVVKRWQDSGARVLDTATSGAVSVSVCAHDGIRQISRNREADWRFWHDASSR